MHYTSEIDEYHRRLNNLRRSGAKTEGNYKSAFDNLLYSIGSTHHNMIVKGEVSERALNGRNIIRYDASINRIGVEMPHGYWEAKDADDDLRIEIQNKKQRGYKLVNIIFENTREFILYQDDIEQLHGSVTNPKELGEALYVFFHYTNDFEKKFIRAKEQFKNNIGNLAYEVKKDISALYTDDAQVRVEIERILLSFQEFNSALQVQDILDVMVQHAITMKLFRAIFRIDDLEKFNPVIQAIDTVVYRALQRKKHAIDTHIEGLFRIIENSVNTLTANSKQDILIMIYEEFYKAYDPKKADTHGIVYTPSTVVDFMVQSCDMLMQKYFNKNLNTEGIRIVDPCVGTGTFITGLLRYMNPFTLQTRIHDIYAIDVDVMAYYMALLNIQNKYTDITGDDIDFENLALADTLEIPTLHNLSRTPNKDTNRSFEYDEVSYQGITPHNAAVVKKIQESDFLLIIGNPPYNAAQKNENENNRNKRYSYIDKRITETYSKESTAQKLKLTDMYTRFMRWASDKVLYKHDGEHNRTKTSHNEGMHAINTRDGAMLCFITNRSYIDKFNTDGIRKSWVKEWDYIYIVDLGGDLRSTPKDIQTGRVKGNVFHIQTGVAIAFLIQDPYRTKTETGEKRDAEIYYTVVPDDYWTKEEKIQWLIDNKQVLAMHVHAILPDEKGNWLRQGEHDFASFISMGDKATKAGKASPDTQSIFTLYSLGVATNRDEWVYDFSRERLHNKMKHFIAEYEAKRVEFHQLPAETQKAFHNKDNHKHLQDWLGNTIKWSDTQRIHILANQQLIFDNQKIIPSLYRPFVKKYFYAEYFINDRLTNTHNNIFGATGTLENRCIILPTLSTQRSFCTFIMNIIPDLNLLQGGQLFPRYRYASHTRADIHAGRIPERIDNITDAALQQFIHCYNDSTISKDAIFYYVYAVLNHTAYTTRYADNLRQELPRIPYYTAFHELTTLGAKLATIHLNWEHAKPYPFTQHTPESRSKKAPPRTQYALRYNKQRMENGNVVDNFANNTITISNQLTLGEVPHACTQYTLGGRCAIDWVLEFYKESKNKPKDAAIQTLCHNGTLAYYDMDEMLPELLDTLGKVATVSVETMQILADIQAIKLVSM